MAHTTLPEQVISGLVRADSQAPPRPSRQQPGPRAGWSVPWGRATREVEVEEQEQEHGELSCLSVDGNGRERKKKLRMGVYNTSHHQCQRVYF